jgi:cytochrome c oxidase assembly protein subunit 11
MSVDRNPPASPEQPSRPGRPKGYARTALLGVGIVAAMTGLAFAAAPLYDMFCRVTGYGGTTQVASAAPEAVLEQTIEVHFDANVMPGVPLKFRPLERTQTVRIGEMSVVRYVARNTSDQPVEVIATYNVAPHKTGIFFQKMQCFCFENRIIPAGAEVELPVIYFVQPSMMDDRAARDVREITLSYTFFAAADGAKLPALQPVT